MLISNNKPSSVVYECASVEAVHPGPSFDWAHNVLPALLAASCVFLRQPRSLTSSQTLMKACSFIAREQES